MIPGVNPEEWRRDYFDRVIHWQEFGMKTEHGWRLALIDPAAKRKPVRPNLEAVQWQPFSRRNSRFSNFAQAQHSKFTVARGGNTVQKVEADAQRANRREHAPDIDEEIDVNMRLSELRAQLEKASENTIATAMAALATPSASDADEAA